MAQAQYYYQLGPNYIDNAIDAIEKARQLSPEKVLYSINAASYYDYKAALSDDNYARQKAIDILNEILDSPSLKETQGPQQFRNINNRAVTYRYLAWLYLDSILNNPEWITEEQRQQWLDLSEEAVYEIEQIYGSGEDPEVIKWRGILDLAKGSKAKGVQKLYTLFQQQKAAKRTDTPLAYFLAEEFKNSKGSTAAAIDF